MVVLMEQVLELEESEQVDIDTWQGPLRQHSLPVKGEYLLSTYSLLASL